MEEQREVLVSQSLPTNRFEPAANRGFIPDRGRDRRPLFDCNFRWFLPSPYKNKQKLQLHIANRNLEALCCKIRKS